MTTDGGERSTYGFPASYLSVLVDRQVKIQCRSVYCTGATTCTLPEYFPMSPNGFQWLFACRYKKYKNSAVSFQRWFVKPCDSATILACTGAVNEGVDKGGQGGLKPPQFWFILSNSIAVHCILSGEYSTIWYTLNNSYKLNNFQSFLLFPSQCLACSRCWQTT